MKFVKEGYGVKRHPVMYNDFVVVGPKSDPAGIKGMKDVGKALTTIMNKKADFISRGDNSGTNKAELRLWKASGIDIAKQKGPWYKAIGQGMGATLNTAAASNAYTLTDRATWIHFKNKQNLVIEVEGDKRLFNQYGVFLVNPKKLPAREGQARPGIHRLPDLAGRPEGDPELQGRRPAAVLPGRQRPERVT